MSEENANDPMFDASRPQRVVWDMAFEITDETALKAAIVHIDADSDGYNDDRTPVEAVNAALTDLFTKAFEEKCSEIGLRRKAANYRIRWPNHDGSYPKVVVNEIPADIRPDGPED